MALSPEEKLKRRLARYPEAIQMTDAGTARPKVAEAVRHLRSGLIGREIAEAMGLSKSQVSQLLNDPTDDRNRARKAAYYGECEECGGRTAYKTGGAARLCDNCHRTKNAERNAEILRRWEAGETGGAIAAALGTTYAAVRGVVQPADTTLHRRRNRTEWDAIERLWAEGLSRPKIAQELGITEWNLSQYIARMRAAGRNLPYRMSEQGRRNIREAMQRRKVAA